MLSEYQLQIIEENELSLGKNEKLIPNLGNKIYKLHYKNVKTCLKLVLGLRKFIEHWNSNEHHSYNHISNEIQNCESKR